ncbi:MAG TPA: ATP-binding protein [Gemmatimonadaceae bacterium]
MIRVVLTGSESTGKTTLAGRLSKFFNAPLVEEFVRGYAAAKGGELEFSDHGPIARGQLALEDDAIAKAPQLIVQDTDLLSTVVYCDHYFGKAPEWIVEAAAQRLPDLYLLCEIDIDWVADGVRDRGHMREEMQQLFRDAVSASGATWLTITGGRDDRFQIAVDAINTLLLEQK